MASHPFSLTSYMEAWNASDAEVRDARLSECWAEAGVYADPMTEVSGQDALSAYIAQIHERIPGARLVLTGPVAMHHDRMHFTWNLELPDGSVPTAGRDFVRLDPDGRIREVTGFFEAPPARDPAGG